MKMVRFLVCALMVAVVSFSSLVSQVDAAVSVKSAKKVDDRAYVFEALRAMEKVESGYFEFLIEVNSPFGNANIMNKTEFHGVKDSVMKTLMEGVYHPLEGKSEKFSMLQYMQLDKDKMTVYSQMEDKKWTKTIMDNAVKNEDSTFDQAIVDRMIKSAVIKDENEKWISVDVAINMAEVQKIYSEALKEINAAEKLPMVKIEGTEAVSVKEIEKLVDAMVKGIDGVVFNMVIDKKSKYIQGIHCDLSKPVQSGLTAAIGTLKEKEAEKAVYKALAEKVNILIQGDFSKFNKVNKFAVPSDIVKNAVEEKLVLDDKIAVVEKKPVVKDKKAA